MITNIIALVLGIFIGQEFNELPRVKPYFEASVRQIIQKTNEILENARKNQ